jgi:tetratricopeptide (TPR) repeat protein
VSSLADRLRGVIRHPSTGGPEVVQDEGVRRPDRVRHDAAADVLDGDWRESGGQRYLVVERRYAPGYRHGEVAVADALPPVDGVWPKLPLLAGTPCQGRMLFVDLETTGLAGGAGTYAFLVGCGWFESGAFRVRQFFLASFDAERALLEAVAEAVEAAGTVVTFNGKSFDLPLLDNRFVMHRLEAPFNGMPHVDMVHPARRLWKGDDGRLSTLEQTQCRHHREGDVPGFEIPSRYFRYVRSGDARALEAVMEHNRLDLLSLALLTARASQLLEDGPAAARTAKEALGIGRLYERAGLLVEARASFDRAATMMGGDPVTRAEALRAYAVLSRRQRRFHEAADAWRRLLAVAHCPEVLLREATTALAVHHEHRLRDPRSARTFALESMRTEYSISRRQALEYRLARLNRKLGDAESAALF